MTIHELYDLFARWSQENDRAEATVRYYRARLRIFFARFGERDFSSLQKIEILDWLSAAARKPDGSLWAPDTRRGNVIAFERFQQFAIQSGALEKSIIDKLEKPAGSKRQRIATDAETAALLHDASEAFRLIYRALRQCGARPGELCRATFADWHREAGVIQLAQHKTARKTGKPRTIHIGAKLKAILDEATLGRNDGPLFLTERGRPWKVSHLSTMFRGLRRRVKLSDDLVLYCTRHEFGTKALKANGGNIRNVAEFLGHSSIVTTQRYTHPAADELRSQQDLVD